MTLQVLCSNWKTSSYNNRERQKRSFSIRCLGWIQTEISIRCLGHFIFFFRRLPTFLTHDIRHVFCDAQHRAAQQYMPTCPAETLNSFSLVRTPLPGSKVYSNAVLTRPLLNETVYHQFKHTLALKSRGFPFIENLLGGTLYLTLLVVIYIWSILW